MSTYGCCNAMCSLWYTTTALANKIPRSLVNWTHTWHDEAGTFSSEPATTIAELWQRVQDACDNLLQDDIQHLYNCLHVKNISLHCCQRGTLYINVTVWTPFTLTCLLHLVWICHHYSYNDKLPVTMINYFQYNELVLEGVAFLFYGSVCVRF